MDEWITIYDDFDDASLDAEIVRLRAQSLNPYNAQTEGTRSYARSTTEVRDRLAAATQVRKSRSNTTPRHGRADFSCVRQ